MNTAIQFRARLPIHEPLMNRARRLFAPLAFAGLARGAPCQEAAVAISNAYYPDQRNAGSALSKLGMQVGGDTVGNVLKEFWPDLQHKFGGKPRNQLTAGDQR